MAESISKLENDQKSQGWAMDGLLNAPTAMTVVAEAPVPLPFTTVVRRELT
jgi:hypothetical protein